MKEKLLAVMMAFLTLLSLSACKGLQGEKTGSSSAVSEEELPPPDPNWPVTIGDIRLDEKPDAFVSLSPALTEIIGELGGEENLLGVSDFCDYPETVQSLERCGTPDTPNFEKLEALKPRLIFTTAPLSQEDTLRLQQQNADVVTLARADSLDSLQEIYLIIAQLIDGAEDGRANGEDLFAAMRTRYEALEVAAAKVPQEYSGVWLRAAPLVMATADTFENELLERYLGIKNDAAEFRQWQYPADKAVNLYPDVVFFAQSINADYFKGTQIYNTTDAYKQNRIYAFDPIVFERQSGRMLTELERMFALVWPEAQAPPQEASGE